MVSLMKNGDVELDMRPESIEERGGEDERSMDSRVIGEARVSEMELDLGGSDSTNGPRVSEEARVNIGESKESDGGESGGEMEGKESEVKAESSSAEEEEEEEEEEFEEEDEDVKNTGPQFNSLLSEFDDFVANEKSGQMATSRALRFGFEVGDLVWGKVKSHPWWPGHIFNDGFATPQVRRTRREGHVLVAFFGDSSYGWFDPAEFIPFDANFTEKSKQTSSRTFTKAVEEAVDEVSRRSSLGLACKCRSPYSFLPTSLQGYFSVDVPDYEPRAIYSVEQIQKARDNFRPSDALSFIKNLALSPCSSNEKDIEFVKDRARVVAYRKAVFEEFDVTYAQAFGVQPGRPARDRADLPNQAKQPPRALFSGPLVIAETLGGGKSATKEKKAKDTPKKDKYLLKRREELSSLKKGSQVSQVKVSSAAPSVSSEGSVPVGDGDSLLQKRSPDTSLKPEIESKSDADSSLNGSEAVISNHASSSGSIVAQDMSIDTKSSLDKGKGAVNEVKEGSGSVSNCIPVLKGTETSDISRNVTSTDGASQSAEVKHEEFQQPQSVSTVREDGNRGKGKVQDGQIAESQPSGGVKRASGMSKVGGVKKTKVKRPREEPDADNTMVEGKKKRKKKLVDTDTSSKKPQKNLASKNAGLSAGKKSGKPARSKFPKEEVNAEQTKRIASSSNLSDPTEMLQIGDLGNVELPGLLSDLQALALDHGSERSSTAIVRKFFLRFRSLVYQKSLAHSPPLESESLEARPSKSPASTGASDSSSAEHTKEFPPNRPAKPTFRSEDPTISGRKRSLSDRQEDIAAKRSKKVSDIKSLAAEKKNTQKASETYRGGEGRESAVPLGRRTKSDLSKKSELPIPRAAEPTTLVMKFPPKTSLPSPAELKARFARFGPIDQSGLRVFWKSSTCRIVFLHKSDAQAACKYAAANASLFGSPGMRCFVKDPAGPEGTDDNPTSTQCSSKDSEPHRPMPSTQLKSCLKKPSADETGANSRVTPRVKFVLAGEESTNPEPSLAGNRNTDNNNNSGTGFGDGGALIPSTSSTTSSVAMDFSVRNNQKVVLPPSQLPPILPLPPQFTKTTPNNNNLHQHLHHHHHNQHYNHSDAMIGPRNTHNSNTPNSGAPLPPPPSISNNVDISQQMLSLLTRCNDVVTNITGFLGYVPYHPL